MLQALLEVNLQLVEFTNAGVSVSDFVRLVFPALESLLLPVVGTPIMEYENMKYNDTVRNRGALSVN